MKRFQKRNRHSDDSARAANEPRFERRTCLRPTHPQGDKEYMKVVIRKIFAAKFRRHCLLLILLAMSTFARAERLPIKTYTPIDGLAHNFINKIVRDSRGFLWFCTGDGLSRFDGYTFTNYGTDQGLPHREVADLLETRSGEYWVATK